jgi:hypothetical protein
MNIDAGSDMFVQKTLSGILRKHPVPPESSTARRWNGQKLTVTPTIRMTQHISRRVTLYLGGFGWS